MDRRSAPAPMLGPVQNSLQHCVVSGCVCSCCSWFQIVDHLGSVLYTINIPLCECWAAPRPTICCPLWQAEVRRGEGDGGTVATLQNIFAGCNIRGLFTKADNFQASGVCLSVARRTILHCTCVHTAVQIARPVAVRRELMPRRLPCRSTTWITACRRSTKH